MVRYGEEPLSAAGREIRAMDDTIRFCRGEAARLRALTRRSEYTKVRDDLIKIAEAYDALAYQYERVAKTDPLAVADIRLSRASVLI